MERRRYNLATRLLAVLVIGLGLAQLLAGRPDEAAGQSPLPSTLTMPLDGLSAERIIERLIDESRQRESRMRQYSVPSTYRVTGDDGRIRAEVEAVLRYRAPGSKEFTIISAKGSETIRNRVFKPLMEVEIETAAGRNRHDGSISPANYDFRLLGEEAIAGNRCYVLEAMPRRTDKYLFRGRIWVHATEFSIVRIAGEPAKSPSFWISRLKFVRNYQKVGEFWLPARNESQTQVRFFGRNLLTIDYGTYEIS
jgi:hypothetical protein